MGQFLVVVQQSGEIWYRRVSAVKCGFVPVNMLVIPQISGNRNGVPRPGAPGPEPSALDSSENLLTRERQFLCICKWV